MFFYKSQYKHENMILSNEKNPSRVTAIDFMNTITLSKSTDSPI
jgi:hypothetical protein